MDVVSKFVESWRNLNPHRNKKAASRLASIPLSNSTKRAELERLGFFLRYCQDREWIKANHASKIKFKSKVEKKFGMEPEEERLVFESIQFVEDGRGRTGQYNAQELYAFCLVMRYAGLRIGDTTTLNDGQLVRRQSGRGWALRVFQQKTEEWVYIPIPEFVETELRKLKCKAKKTAATIGFGRLMARSTLRSRIGEHAFQKCWRSPRKTVDFCTSPPRTPSGTRSRSGT